MQESQSSVRSDLEELPNFNLLCKPLVPRIDPLRQRLRQVESELSQLRFSKQQSAITISTLNKSLMGKTQQLQRTQLELQRVRRELVQVSKESHQIKGQYHGLQDELNKVKRQLTLAQLSCKQAEGRLQQAINRENSLTNQLTFRQRQIKSNEQQLAQRNKSLLKEVNSLKDQARRTKDQLNKKLTEIALLQQQFSSFQNLSHKNASLEEERYAFAQENQNLIKINAVQSNAINQLRQLLEQARTSSLSSVQKFQAQLDSQDLQLKTQADQLARLNSILQNQQQNLNKSKAQLQTMREENSWLKMNYQKLLNKNGELLVWKAEMSKLRTRAFNLLN